MENDGDWWIGLGLRATRILNPKLGLHNRQLWIEVEVSWEVAGKLILELWT